MHGLGNDFIVIDSRAQNIDLESCNWVKMANRREGIGCDQILVLKDDHSGATAGYEVWNADGTTVEQCGNGIRCLAMFLNDRGEAAGGIVKLAGPAGPIHVECSADNSYRVNMGKPSFDAAHLPLKLQPQQKSKVSLLTK